MINNNDPIKTDDELVKEYKGMIIEMSPSTKPEDIIISISRDPNDDNYREFDISIKDANGKLTSLSFGTDEEVRKDLTEIIKPIVDKTGLSLDKFNSFPNVSIDKKTKLKEIDPVTGEKIDATKNYILNNSDDSVMGDVEKKVNERHKSFKLDEPVAITKVNPLTGDADIRYANNKLQLLAGKQKGYITDEERTKQQTTIEVPELKKLNINNKRYNIKVADENAPTNYVLVDNKTGVVRPISNKAMFAVNSKNNDLVVTDADNLENDLKIDRDIPISKETIGDYIDDNKYINTSPKELDKSSKPTAETTEEATKKESFLGDKITKLMQDLETGDKIGLAAMAAPALFNIGRGLIEKAEDYKPIYNDYAKSALNDMRQRRFSIDRTPGRLKTQAAMKQIQDNSLSNASRMANLANMAAADKRQEDAMSVQEANVNQMQIPQENANFAYQVGESNRQAQEQARGLDIRAKAAKDNILTTGLTQLGNVGQSYGNLLNAHKYNQMMLDLMKTGQYGWVDGEIRYIGDKPEKQPVNPTVTPNKPFTTKSSIMNNPFNVKPVTSINKPVLGESLINPEYAKEQTRLNIPTIEYQQGGYTNKVKQLKDLKKRLKRLKRR